MEDLRNLNKKTIAALAALSVIILIGGFWAGYDYKASEIRSAFDEAFSSSEDDSQESESESEDKAIDDFKVVEYEIGEEVTYATQTMKVNSVETRTSISSEYSSPLIASEGAKFIVVNHTVTNTTDSPFMYESFGLIDNKDRQYTATDAIGNIDNYLDVRDLAPGIKETGVVVFEVPDDSETFLFGGVKGQTSEIHAVNISSN